MSSYRLRSLLLATAAVLIPGFGCGGGGGGGGGSDSPTPTPTPTATPTPTPGDPVSGLVTVDSAEVQSAGGGSSSSISPDGRYVAFAGVAADLVAGDTNGVSDIFIRDTVEGTTVRVSLNSAGEESTAGCTDPSISADGLFVAFVSGDGNLVAGDNNGLFDVFVRDVVAGTTTRVSVSSAETQTSTGSSSKPSISADGLFVAFESASPDLVTGDNNGFIDIFVRDIAAGTTGRVSLDSSLAESNGNSRDADISANGEYVAFSSVADNLNSDDVNTSEDVFRRNRTTGVTLLVSADFGGVGADAGSLLPSISADGRFVAFESLATNILAGDGNGERDIFVRDVLSSTTAWVSTDTAGIEGDGQSTDPSISTDGDYVVFSSAATNLVGTDTNGLYDVFLRDRIAGTTTRLTLGPAAAEADGHTFRARISADGRFATLDTSATNLVVGDNNGTDDIILTGPL